MAKKILLADDSLTIQKVVELTFSDSDFDLVCVSNGQKALDKVRDDRPDLILADVVMPEKNGYEVCEAIKGNPLTARIPVVLLSGTFEPFDRERAERIGCDAIVSKPFDSQQLISQVEALLGRSHAETPEPEAPPAETPPPAASTEPEKAPYDAGFSSDDFTGSFRVTPRSDHFDAFEEEYGARADVDSAILAFERAHPEFSGSSKDSDDGGGAFKPEGSSAPPWLIDEPEPTSSSSSSSDSPRGGLWGATDDEPAAALDFDAERSGSYSSGSRADEGPTQEIRQESFSSSRNVGGSSWRAREPEEISAEDAEVLFDVEGPEEEEQASHDASPIEEPVRRTTDEAVSQASEETTAPMTSAEPQTPELPAAGAPSAKATAVATELEVLAQTASIPELTTMLSSVMRAGSELSDAEIDRLAHRVIEKLTDRIVREIAWEVIPDMAEIVIKERIKELESGAE